MFGLPTPGMTLACQHASIGPRTKGLDLFLLIWLELDLFGLRGDDFRHAPVLFDLPSDTDRLSPERDFGLAELRTVRPPNQDSENLSGVGLVEVEEGRLASAPRRISRAGDFAAHRGCLADVILRVASAYRLRA